MTTMRKTIQKGASSKGETFALVTDGVTFEVWKLCENYSRHVPGGIANTWRFVQKGMTEAEGGALFDKRAA